MTSTVQELRAFLDARLAVCLLQERRRRDGPRPGHHDATQGPRPHEGARCAQQVTDPAASFCLGSPTCRVRSAHMCGTHGRGGEGREEAHGRAPQPGDGKQLVSVRCGSEMLMLLGLRDILDLRQGLEIE